MPGVRCLRPDGAPGCAAALTWHPAVFGAALADAHQQAAATVDVSRLGLHGDGHHSASALGNPAWPPTEPCVRPVSTGAVRVAPRARLRITAMRCARGFTRLSIIKTVIFLIAGKLNLQAINPHAGQPT